MVKKGYKHSEESKKKISEAKKGTKISDETRKRLSESLKGRSRPDLIGKKLSKEHRGKMSESLKGKKPSEETIKKISESNKGQKRSEAIRKRISEAKKGKPVWNKGIKQTEEHRKKNSESHKGQIPWMTGKKHSEEYIKKISESGTWFKKGNPTWNKGKTGIYSDETRKRLSEARSKQVFPFRDSIPEKMMETALRLENIEFKKHKSFKIGNSNHQVDFFIEPNICIEVDGIYWHNIPKQIEQDKRIDVELNSKGFQVIRIIAPKFNKDFDVKSHAEKIRNILYKIKG